MTEKPNKLVIELINLANTWHNRSQRKWTEAKLEPDVMIRKIIEHGAICCENCLSELRDLLNDFENLSE